MKDKKIPVFYRPEMCADAHSFSPSPGKPRPVVEAWLREGFPIELRSFDPLTRAEIAVAHNYGMVNAVLDLETNNGFGNKSKAVAASLPYTTASMRAAVHAAMDNGVGAVSPTSGFHHATYTSPSAYCTFNGLMIAAIPLLRDNWKVGILDFDMHFGDGTENIAWRLRLDQSQFVHYTQGGKPRVSGDRWLSVLPALVENLFKGCDVVLYQAGADPHIDDPLGRWLTTEEIFERDRIVFSTLRSMKVPVAWNLAGGYQDPLSKVIEIHTNTMRAFSESFYKEI